MNKSITGSISKDLSAQEIENLMLLKLRQALSKLNQIDFEKIPSVHEILILIAKLSYQIVSASSVVVFPYNGITYDFDLGSIITASKGKRPQQKGDGYSVTPISLEDSPLLHKIGRESIRLRSFLTTALTNEIPNNPQDKFSENSSSTCFPLVHGNDAYGIIIINLCENNKISQSDLLLLEIWIDQASLVLRHANAIEKYHENIKQKENEVKKLQDATSLLFSRLGLEDTLNAILTMALELTGAHYGIFRLIDEGKNKLVTSSFVGVDMQRPKIEELPIDEHSVMGKVAITKKPALIPDLSKLPLGNYYPLDDDIVMRSELAIPLLNSNGGLEGVLNLESPLPGAFTSHHQFLIESLATTAVLAIREFRLLNFFLEVTTNIFKISKYQTLDYLVKQTSEFSNSANCEIWSVDDSRLRLIASSKVDDSSQVIPFRSLPEPIVNTFYDLKDFPVENLVEHYSKFAAISISNSLVAPLFLSEKKVPEYFMVVCGYPEKNDLVLLRNDWNLRILNFILSFVHIAIENDDRNNKLKMEQEQRMLAETFAAIGDVASNILHIVNNKVGLIPVKIQTILEKRKSYLAEDEYLTRNLGEIEKFATEAMQTVSKNLINLRPIAVGEVDLGDEIQKVVHEFREQKNVVITLNFDNDLPLVQANEQSVKFIFLNILENAIQAMDGIGKIEIEVVVEPEFVSVLIQDNGPGINDSLQTKLFEFGNLQTNATQKKNLGFGLWWVKTILSRLGGKISLKSSEGSGSTFTISLPRVKSGIT
jgi:signal transduction histidine kinase/GAF domain-containing protein